MDSSVRDLLDGDLRDLLTAYSLLVKHIANHEREIDPVIVSKIRQTCMDLEEGIEQLACAECWATNRKPYRMGLVISKHHDNLCEPCAEKRSAKRDPFGGVITYRSDE